MIDAIGGLIQTALELIVAWCKPTTIEGLARTALREKEKLPEESVFDQ